eukprot:6205872-Pleurochrysis_carterae.AAC.2
MHADARPTSRAHTFNSYGASFARSWTTYSYLFTLFPQVSHGLQEEHRQKQSSRRPKRALLRRSYQHDAQLRALLERACARSPRSCSELVALS